MNFILLTIHILGCLALIGIVLIQGGKGAEVGAAFGAGASNTIFGASGGQSFISKMTTGVAVIFMLTSLTLAMFWGTPGASSIMPEQVAPTSAPASMPVQATPATTTETSTPEQAAPASVPDAMPGQSVPPTAPVENAK